MRQNGPLLVRENYFSHNGPPKCDGGYRESTDQLST